MLNGTVKFRRNNLQHIATNILFDEKYTFTNVMHINDRCHWGSESGERTVLNTDRWVWPSAVNLTSSNIQDGWLACVCFLSIQCSTAPSCPYVKLFRCSQFQKWDWRTILEAFKTTGWKKNNLFKYFWSWSAHIVWSGFKYLVFLGYTSCNVKTL